MKSLSIFFLFTSFLFLSALQAQSNATFIGVWGPGTQHQAFYPSTKNYFETEKKAKNGGYSLLSDFEIITKNLTEYSWTVWEKPGRGSRARTEVRVGTWFETLSDMKQFAAKPQRGRTPTKPNMYLKNIEVFYSVGERRTYYHSVYQSGYRKQRIEKADSWMGFVNTWKDQNSRNMRLKSVETFKEGNRQYFVGIFEAGTQGYYLFHLEGWKNFSKKWEELGKKNYRLIDIETYIHNGKRMYIGVWEPGKGGYYLWQVKGYQNFAKKFLELNGKMELIDLEVIY